MPVRNVVHQSLYFDSVVLMRVASQLGQRQGVDVASLVMGTPANLDVLAQADLLADDGKAARPNDLVVAVRADDDAMEDVLAAAEAALNGSANDGATGDASEPIPVRRLAAAPESANLAVISTPGQYAAAEGLKALRRGMHVFMFSDNVPLEQELELKRTARERGLLVMGPDCGTAMVGGVPLGFTNVLRRGPVGLVGASGTGLQQVSSLVHDYGSGISQMVGVGSHDVSAEVGALSMLDALDALGADPATEVVVLVSKPPAPEVADRVLERAGGLGKPVVACFLGYDAPVSGSVVAATTLRDAAQVAVGLLPGIESREQGAAADPAAVVPAGRRWLRGLFAGGTFAYEADLLLAPQIGRLEHEVAGWSLGSAVSFLDAHTILDLGDDGYTSGRPHPMIDATVRKEFLRSALADPTTAVVLLDVVLGHGAAADPAGDLADVLGPPGGTGDGPLVVAAVVGTDADPQDAARQAEILREAGALVVGSSTDAAELAAALLTEGEADR